MRGDKVAPGTDQLGGGAGIRPSFVARFGEDQASAVEVASEMHVTSANSKNRGSDLFRWSICICIGYECMSNPSYREHHGITAPWDEIDQWIKDEADLRNHDGDVDYLALFAGRYEPYANQEAPAAPLTLNADEHSEERCTCGQLTPWNCEGDCGGGK